MLERYADQRGLPARTLACAWILAQLHEEAAGLLAAVVSDHVLIAALIVGVRAAIAVLAVLIHFQVSARRRAAALPAE